ncbi:MAG: class B sortase [Ruminococcaceae bacterium]|nr:class B sortase [Oscillospiraceae bacterium]
MGQKTKRKNKNSLLIALLVVFTAVFLFSGAMLVKNIVTGRQEQSAFEELSTPMDNLDMTLSEQERNEIAFTQYAKLKEQNPHYVGWLEIEGTKLDYPVVHTPDNPEYYLRRAFDGSYAVSGTPFVGDGCNVDSRLLIVYGHHMNNGTMFATLHNYKDKEYWESHKELSFDTLDQLRTYEIVSAFYTEIDYTGELGTFDYYNYYGDVSDSDFETYVQNIKALSMYDMGVDVQAEDKLITLSTCSYHHENGRFVLVAKLKDVVAKE